jgi:hypothetical protein
MKDAFLVKNLYNYEKVIAPPCNLPVHIKTVYVTDTIENVKLAASLGWSIVKHVSQFKDKTDPLSRRQSVAFINCYPHLVVPEIGDFDRVFVCDSNISSVWNKYEDFVKQCPLNKALYLTSGYYSGNRDNIKEECFYSTTPGHRWSYNRDSIIKSTDRYVNDLIHRGISWKDLSIASAKYIGWNLKHPKIKIVTKLLFDEYQLHLQGNIILTWMSGAYSDIIFNYVNSDYSGTTLNKHNFPA